MALLVARKYTLIFILNGKIIKDEKEFINYLKKEFAGKNPKVIKIVIDKLRLLEENPFKYSREKLKEYDKYIICSIEVTGDLRILYAIDKKMPIVYILGVGNHKEIYGKILKKII